MRKLPVCPYCDVELENTETVHGDYISDQYTDEVTGTCPQCKHNYYWKEVFTYNRSWGFEEETSSGSAFEIMPKS